MGILNVFFSSFGGEHHQLAEANRLSFAFFFRRRRGLGLRNFLKPRGGVTFPCERCMGFPRGHPGDGHRYGDELGEASHHARARVPGGGRSAAKTWQRWFLWFLKGPKTSHCKVLAEEQQPKKCRAPHQKKVAFAVLGRC